MCSVVEWKIVSESMDGTLSGRCGGRGAVPTPKDQRANQTKRDHTGGTASTGPRGGSSTVIGPPGQSDVMSSQSRAEGRLGSWPPCRTGSVRFTRAELRRRCGSSTLIDPPDESDVMSGQSRSEGQLGSGPRGATLSRSVSAAGGAQSGASLLMKR